MRSSGCQEIQRSVMLHKFSVNILPYLQVAKGMLVACVVACKDLMHAEILCTGRHAGESGQGKLKRQPHEGSQQENRQEGGLWSSRRHFLQSAAAAAAGLIAFNQTAKVCAFVLVSPACSNFLNTCQTTAHLLGATCCCMPKSSFAPNFSQMSAGMSKNHTDGHRFAVCVASMQTLPCFQTSKQWYKPTHLAV